MHFCNMRMAWGFNLFALHREKVEIQLITRQFHHKPHHRILNNLWHFWQVWNVSKFETVCPPSTRSYLFFYLPLLLFAWAKSHHSCFPALSLPVWHGGHLRQPKLERAQRRRWRLGRRRYFDSLFGKIDQYNLGRRRTETNRITPASSGSFLKSRKG